MIVSVWFHYNNVIGERHSLSNRQQLDYLLDIWFKLTAKKSPQLHIDGPLWKEFTGGRWVPLVKGSVMGKMILCHDVIMFIF